MFCALALVQQALLAILFISNRKPAANRRQANSLFMKKIFLALLTSVCLSVAAQAPQAPEVAARSYLLMDVTADQILAQKDIDLPVEPASLTKP